MAMSSESTTGELSPSTSSVRASRVRTRRPPASAQALTPAPEADSGGRLSAPFAHFDPASSSWRTAQGCLPLDEASIPSRVTWPKAGIASRGRASELPTLEPLIGASESSSSLLPTCLANDDKGPQKGPRRQGGDSLANLLPTTTARDGKGSRRATAAKGALEVAWWDDARRRGVGAAPDTDSDALRVEPERKQQHEAERWDAESMDFGRFRPAIERWERILGRVAPPLSVTGARGQPVLNPAFSEWMMGLPPGWTEGVARTARCA